MGEINQNLTGRSLRAFLIDDPVGATSQIIIDFNALFRKLRLGRLSSTKYLTLH
jgi:hypothetical protein